MTTYSIILFSLMGLFHDLGICQMYFVGPPNDLEMFVYYLHIHVELLGKVTVEGSLFRHKTYWPSPCNLPSAMLTFATTHLNPTWKLYFGTCKDEIGNHV